MKFKRKIIFARTRDMNKNAQRNMYSGMVTRGNSCKIHIREKWEKVVQNARATCAASDVTRGNVRKILYLQKLGKSYFARRATYVTPIP